MIMAEGVHPALMDSLLSHYKLRFSDPPAELAARLGAITDPADLRALLPLFARGSAEDIGHLLQGHDS